MSNNYEFRGSIEPKDSILYLNQQKTSIQRIIEMKVTNGLGFNGTMPKMVFSEEDRRLYDAIREAFGDKHTETYLQRHLKRLEELAN